MLLVVNEIGYLLITRTGAMLFFSAHDGRYEHASMVLTSNKGFEDWGDVLGDRVIAPAILDRLLHHAITVSIRGQSYRLKAKLKAGLVSYPFVEADSSSVRDLR